MQALCDSHCAGKIHKPLKPLLPILPTKMLNPDAFGTDRVSDVSEERTRQGARELLEQRNSFFTLGDGDAQWMEARRVLLA